MITGLREMIQYEQNGYQFCMVKTSKFLTKTDELDSCVLGVMISYKTYIWDQQPLLHDPEELDPPGSASQHLPPQQVST